MWDEIEWNKSWNAHLQGSSNTILPWKLSNRDDTCYEDICKLYANGSVIPEYGLEDKSLLEPIVLIGSSFSVSAISPRWYQVLWLAWQLSVISNSGAHLSSLLPFWPQRLLYALLRSTPVMLSSLLKHPRDVVPVEVLRIVFPRCQPGSLLCFTLVFRSAVTFSWGLPRPPI